VLLILLLLLLLLLVSASRCVCVCSVRSLQMLIIICLVCGTMTPCDISAKERHIKIILLTYSFFVLLTVSGLVRLGWVPNSHADI